MRAAWSGLGSVALVFGVIGIVVPGWPTTIFLIIAAACYAHSSQRMYDRILANRVFGGYVRRFRETGGMPLRAKVLALDLMWPFVLFAVLVAIPAPMLWARVLTAALGVAGTLYIIRLPTVEMERSGVAAAPSAAPSHGPPLGATGHPVGGGEQRPPAP